MVARGACRGPANVSCRCCEAPGVCYHGDIDVIGGLCYRVIISLADRNRGEFSFSVVLIVMQYSKTLYFVDNSYRY